MAKQRRRIETYLDRLYRYAFSLSREEETARELVQLTALKALSARSVPRDEPAYRAWLFRILRNAFFDRLRRDRRSAEIFEDMPDEPAPMEYWGGDERLINAASVRIAFGQLSAGHRDILALVDLAGFSYREAAEVLDVPVGTVMSRISRARRALLNEIAASNVRAFPTDQAKQSL
jgi:RNA polymerase sigma-70 factor (ECF subfamily)